MKFLKKICCGMFIGVANILPGVSGGTLAISMGVYDKIIYAVTHIKKEFRESLRILMPVGIGILLGFSGLSYIIRWMFLEYPVQTHLLFTGLILGGIPEILKVIEMSGFRAAGIFVFAIFFLLTACLPLFGGDTQTVVLEISMIMAVKLFAIGVLAAATMVIPGVSGSMILLLLGYYQPLLDEITESISGFLEMNLQQMMHGVLLLGPMAAGVVTGVFLIANLIEFLFKHHKIITYWGILGLIFASPVGILSEIRNFSVDFFTILTGIIAFVFGILIVKQLGEKES